MALAATITWEVRPGGSDNNGGGFNTSASGTDFSVQDAAQASGTDGVLGGGGGTTLSSASHNFVAADIGNVVQIRAGTGFTVGFYEIISVASNVATLDRSAGTNGSTGGTYAMGGGLASIGKAAGAMVASNALFVKAGSYSMTTASTNVAGGAFLWTTVSPDKTIVFVTGYNTNRNHQNRDATKPVITATGGTSYNMFETSGAPQNFAVRNIELDAASRTGVNTFKLYGSFGGARGANLKASNAVIGFDLNTDGRLLNCEALGCSTYHFVSQNPSLVMFCYAHDGAGDGFASANDAMFVHCIADTVGGKGFNDLSTAYMSCHSCTAYNCTGDGFYFGSSAGRNQSCYNCLADSNGGYGFNASTASQSVFLLNCAYRNNTSGNVNSSVITTPEESSVLLTVSPFVDGPGGNFTPNAAAGGGAALRAAAWPTTLGGSATLPYLDIGAVQHQDGARPPGFQIVRGPGRRFR